MVDESRDINSDPSHQVSLPLKLLPLLPRPQLWNDTKQRILHLPILHHVIQRRRQRHNADVSDTLGKLTTLLRMTSTRRLVTGLHRLLVSKSGVIGQVKKRLLNPAMKGGKQSLIVSEISIHMDDING